MLRVPGTGFGKLDRGEHFVIVQGVFARGILLWEREEVGRRERALAGGSDDAELGVERDQRGRGIRRMHDEARSAAEDGVELVLAGDRETLVAAGLVARETVAEIPAPGALADVARERARIANLRRGDAGGGFGQHGVFARDERVAAERVERDLSADAHGSAFGFDLIEPFDSAQVDQNIGVDDALLHQAEQIAATARERDGLAVATGACEASDTACLRSRGLELEKVLMRMLLPICRGGWAVLSS